MPSTIPSSPYVGLRPFREEDFALFFGRDREIRVIASNLQARALTVLYGASGVGKSSVLQAGVLRRLKQEPETSVYYFRDWQTDSLLTDILRKAYEFLPADNAAEIATEPPAGTTNTPAAVSQPVKTATGRTFLLLDQFEEFLLYHANDSLGEEFASVLSRIVNRKDCPVNVLIGIRDDSLFKLDRRFGLRIPNLLRDTLEVERMAPPGARSAIEKPLAVFSKMFGNGKQYDIEKALVDEICQQVQAGHVLLGESLGIGSKGGRQKENRIETAYLQLVLTKLWDEEQRRNSPTLRLRTLQELGGADNIVRSHVNSVMNQLANRRERDIAANMFRYLVTPSRSKIAQATTDLVSYAERPEREVKKVLDALTDRSESRILRRLSDPEQYEIFHDVLAQPLLDWRRAHAEAQATRRLWRLIAGAGVVTLLFAILAAYAWVEGRRADDYARIARAEKLQAQLAQKQTQVTLDQLRAIQAESEGNKTAADRFRAQASESANQAATLQQTYLRQQQALSTADKQVYAEIQTAHNERDAAALKLSAVQKERDDLKSELEATKQQVKDLQKPTGKTASNSPVQAPITMAAQQGKATQMATSGRRENTPSQSPPAPATKTGNAPAPALAPGTEVCAKLDHYLSVVRKINSKVSAVVISPHDLWGYHMDGKLVANSKHTIKGKTALRIDFYSLSSPEHTIPITAKVQAVKTGDKKHPPEVDEEGNIIGHGTGFIPSDSVVCSVITKVENSEPSP